MDKSNFKFPKLSFTGLAVVVALGIITAVGLYQIQLKNTNSLNSNQPSKLEQKESRVVVNEENAVIDVVNKSSDSVIAIGITQKTVDPFNPYALPKSEDSTIGTGFVVSDKGLIVTNKHVVAETRMKYSVVTKEGKKYETKKIYRDPILDLAIVQIEANASDLRSLELGDSSGLKVGQTVIAIGNALGRFTNTVTTGVVSGLGRDVNAGDPFGGSAERLDNLIQTDAAINPGNSGGPLLNSRGQVIGVNVAVTEGAQNIGFAIPVNSVKAIVDEFIIKGKVSRPYLGIRYRFISRDAAILNEVPQGVYIQDIISDGPAYKAGIRTGDIITKIGGQAIDTETKVSDLIKDSEIGATIDLTVWRDKKELKISATVGELPSE